MPKRILAILDTYPALSETFLYTTLQNMERAGFEISILARSQGKSKHLPDLKNVGYLPEENLAAVIKLAVLGWYALRLLLISPGTFQHVCHYLRSHSAGWREKGMIAFRILPLLCRRAEFVYFSFGGLAVKYLEFIQLFPNAVFSLRGSDINIEPLLSSVYRERLKQAIHAARQVHCVCRNIQEKAVTLSGQADAKFSVIYTSVNPLFFDDKPLVDGSVQTTKKIHIISVGRLDWRKGFEHGMLAIRRLVERGIDCSWSIIGDGEYRVALSWAIRDMGLQKVVTLEGGKNQSEILQACRQADIFFHPSIHEGISNAVLEAMALGLPVVVTDVGGMSEVIRDGINAMLVPPRDWQAMAGKLERLSVDAALRQSLGKQACQDISRHYTAERQQQEFKTLFEGSAIHAGN